MATPKQPEPFAAYVIGHRDEAQVHVVVGTRGDAQHKLAQLAKAAYDEQPGEEWMAAARRANARSGYELFRQRLQWGVRGPFPFSIAVKP